MKKNIVKAAIGLLIFIASMSSVASINNVFAVSGSGGPNSTIGANVDPGRGYAFDAGYLLNFALKGALVVGVLLALAFLILGGIEYITSGGEKGKTESARNKITAAVVGLILIAASFAILLLVLRILGINGGLTGALNNVPTINDDNAVNTSGR